MRIKTNTIVLVFLRVLNKVLNDNSIVLCNVVLFA